MLGSFRSFLRPLGSGLKYFILAFEIFCDLVLVYNLCLFPVSPVPTSSPPISYSISVITKFLASCLCIKYLNIFSFSIYLYMIFPGYLFFFLHHVARLIQIPVFRLCLNTYKQFLSITFKFALFCQAEHQLFNRIFHNMDTKFKMIDSRKIFEN